MKKTLKAKIQDYAIIMFVSAATLLVVVTVMMGAQAIIIDTGRAILRH